MKNLICLLLVTAGMIACSSDNSDDNTRNNNSDLIGQWNWTNTDGGIGFTIHETPESTGTNFQLLLNADFSYSFLENGTEVSKGTFQITLKESNLTNEMENFISYSDSFDQPENIVVLGRIFTLENTNILTIDQDANDGIGSRFEKIE